MAIVGCILVTSSRLALLLVAAGCAGHGSPPHATTDAGAEAGDDAAPELAPPRPVAPVSVSFLTSRRPTFRWQLSSGTDGARVEVCADRACTRPVTSFDATGTRGAPDVDLPPGVVFWRLHGTSAGRAAGARTSATWETVVPPVSAPVATAWGSMIDADGDGFADVVVGDSDPNAPTQHVYVHRGGPSGPSPSPSQVLSAPAAVAGYATSLASAGDVDGDGYADLLVGSPGENVVYVYGGGAGGFASVPALVLAGPDKSSFGASVSGAGDVDGDGFADVVVGAPALLVQGDPVQGAATVYFGSAAGLSASKSAPLGPRAGSDAQGFAWFVSEAGDVDGDGLGDVAVWGGVDTADPQYVLVYRGADRPYGAAPGLLLQFDGADPSWLPTANLLVCAGDVNGDGYADLAVSAAVAPAGFAADHVSVFLGGGASPTQLPWRRIDNPLAMGDHFGLTLAGADLDQDGFSDLAATAASYATPPVAALVYAGGPMGMGLTTTMTTPDATTLFDREAASPGDVDGDGYPDLLVAFPARTTRVPGASDAGAGAGGEGGVDGGSADGTRHGAVEVHAGGLHGAGAAARWTLLPPDGAAVAYGASLARP
jgi:hypothetical protein